MARKSIYPASVKPGIPKLGVKPLGWQETTFGDLLEVVERPVVMDDEAEYQLVTAKRNRGGIVAREVLKGQDILTKTQFYVRSGDFVISKRQIIHGACGVVPQQLDGAIVSNEYATLRPKPELLLDFLKHFSHTLFFQQTCFHASVGVDVEKMIFDLHDWLKYKVYIPQPEEQRKITEVLNVWDHAIHLTSQLIAAKQQRKRALMQQLLIGKYLFVRFAEEKWKQDDLGNLVDINPTTTNLAPGEHVSFFQMEDVSEAAKIIQLGQVAEVQTGLAKNTKKVLIDPVELPYLRVANVQDGFLDLSEIKTVTIERSFVHRYLLQHGDVLFTEGGDFDKLGRGTVWKSEIPQCLHQNHVFVVRTKQDILLPQFLSVLAASQYGKSYFIKCSKQSTNLASINSSQLKEFPVLLPPLAEQRRITEILQTCDNEIALLEQKRDLLKQQKQGLMQQLLTGRVRVAVNPVEV